MLYDPLVRKLSTVEPLTAAEVEQVLSLCDDVRRVTRRNDIIAEGDVPCHVHIFLSGWAARYKMLENGSRRITAFLLPGDLCDIHIMTLATMDHGISAITDCEVAFVAREKIEAITRSTPALIRAFLRSTLIDEAVLRQWLVNAGRRDAYQAIGHLLCELHARMRLVGLAPSDRLSLPLTQDELADATGLTPIHVNRVLQRLRHEQLVTLVRRELHIPDVGRLRAACDFSADYLHLEARIEMANPV